MLIKPLLVLCLLVSHWPKQATQESPESLWDGTTPELEYQMCFLGGHQYISFLQGTVLRPLGWGEFVFKSLQYGKGHETQTLVKLNRNT